MARSSAPLLLACAVACGGGGSDADGGTFNPPPPPGGTTAFTCSTTTEVRIAAAGFQPAALSVPGGGCVRFTNADTVAHQPASNPHELHTDCPELNVAAPLAPGANVTAKLRSGPKTCGFHDHLNPPPSPVFAGTVTVTGATPGGDPREIDPPGPY